MSGRSAPNYRGRGISVGRSAHKGERENSEPFEAFVRRWVVQHVDEVFPGLAIDAHKRLVEQSLLRGAARGVDHKIGRDLP